LINILGISAFYHDSAAALVCDGNIIAAAQEERFTRIKHDPEYPEKAINFVLDQGQISFDKVDYVVFYEKPILTFNRLIETYIANAPFGFKSFSKAMPLWLNEKLFQKKIIIDHIKKKCPLFDETKLLFCDHHLSHAASAFYPSPFEESLILTLDGVGEWTTTAVSMGNGNKIETLEEIYYPHSLGLLYSAFTYYLGFKVNSGEYKVMGLAPYGKPIFKDLIFKYLIDVKHDGSFRLNQKYFNYSVGLTMTNDNFSNLFKNEPRTSEGKINQFHMDVASSIQKVIEEIVIKITRNIKKKYNCNNLCLAGGVALNCVANGKIIQDGKFKNVWIQPAAGDAGGALGAALSIWHSHLSNKREVKLNQGLDKMQGSFLGPSYNNTDIEKVLLKYEANYELLSTEDMINFTAQILSEKKAVGWFQGRMEFGPRALGARSILADPRDDNMQKNLNLKIKFRESFRPFAPAILDHKVEEWFDIKSDSPYMLLVAQVKKNKILNYNENYKKNLSGFDLLNLKRSVVPAITHVDYSARVQTVSELTNKKFYDLISKFYKITNCPMLVNTSFNIRGEPIVNTPEDALKCFLGTGLDYLIIENYILDKKKQKRKLNFNYQNSYELD
jgi:carbamoyltransferase